MAVRLSRPAKSSGEMKVAEKPSAAHGREEGQWSARVGRRGRSRLYTAAVPGVKIPRGWRYCRFRDAPSRESAPNVRNRGVPGRPGILHPHTPKPGMSRSRHPHPNTPKGVRVGDPGYRRGAGALLCLAKSQKRSRIQQPTTRPASYWQFGSSKG